MSAYLFLRNKREIAERIDRVLDANLAQAGGKVVNSQIEKWREELI